MAFQYPGRASLPTRSLPLVLGFLTACCACPPGPPADEPLVQGTMRIDTAAEVAELTLRLGGNSPLPADWEGHVDLWVGPDPAAKSGKKPDDPWQQITHWETFEVSGMPWTNPPRSRAWRFPAATTTDILVAARLRPKQDGGREPSHLVAEYFEVRPEGYTWGFTAELIEAAHIPVRSDQAVIGGKPGSDDAPRVGVTFGQQAGQNRFTFTGAQLQGPTHGWRPLRVWMWRLASEDPPAWEDRSMNVADAFWREPSVPPLPQDFPTQANPVQVTNLSADPGLTYWFYAIVEERKDGVTRYHAHRSAESRTGAISDPTPMRMLESPDGDTTSNGPRGS